MFLRESFLLKTRAQLEQQSLPLATRLEKKMKNEAEVTTTAAAKKSKEPSWD